VPRHAAGRLINLLGQAGEEVTEISGGEFSPDPKDDPFYHCALGGDADYIITDNVRDFPPIHGRSRGIAQIRHFEKINGFTILIPRAENQIDYHTCNSSAFKHLPTKGGLLMAIKATKLCESVKPFPNRQSPNLSDAEVARAFSPQRKPLSC
jgi:hypothetical protein